MTQEELDAIIANPNASPAFKKRKQLEFLKEQGQDVDPRDFESVLTDREMRDAQMRQQIADEIANVGRTGAIARQLKNEAGALGGTALGTAAMGAMPSVMGLGTLPALTAGFLTSTALSMGGQKLQDYLEDKLTDVPAGTTPEQKQNIIEEARRRRALTIEALTEKYPWQSKATGFLSGIFAGGFRPSLRQPLTALKGGVKWAQGSSFAKDAAQGGLLDAEKQAIKQTLVQGAMGAGQSAGMQAAAGQPIDPTDMALGALGMVAAEPTRFGTWLSRGAFKPSMETPGLNPGAQKPNISYRGLPELDPVTGRIILNKGGEPSSDVGTGDPTPAMTRIKNAIGRMEVESDIPQTFTFTTKGGKTRDIDILPSQYNLLGQGYPGGPNTLVGASRSSPAKVRGLEMKSLLDARDMQRIQKAFKAQDAAKLRAKRAEDFKNARLEEQAQKALEEEKAMQPPQTSVPAPKPIPEPFIPQVARDVETTLRNRQIPEPQPVDVSEVTVGKSTYTKQGDKWFLPDGREVKDLNLARELNNRAEQIAQENQRRFQDADYTSVEPRKGSEEDDIMSFYTAARRLGLNVGKGALVDEAGRPVRGTSFGDGTTIGISNKPSLVKSDTGFHEMMHKMLDILRFSPNKYEQELFKRAVKIFSEVPFAKQWAAKHADRLSKMTPEQRELEIAHEGFAQGGGIEYFNRIKGLREGDNRFATWFKDVMANIASRAGTEDPKLLLRHIIARSEASKGYAARAMKGEGNRHYSEVNPQRYTQLNDEMMRRGEELANEGIYVKFDRTTIDNQNYPVYDVIVEDAQGNPLKNDQLTPDQIKRIGELEQLRMEYDADFSPFRIAKGLRLEAGANEITGRQEVERQQQRMLEDPRVVESMGRMKELNEELQQRMAETQPEPDEHDLINPEDLMDRPPGEVISPDHFVRNPDAYIDRLAQSFGGGEFGRYKAEEFIQNYFDALDHHGQVTDKYLGQSNEFYDKAQQLTRASRGFVNAMEESNPRRNQDVDDLSDEPRTPPEGFAQEDYRKEPYYSNMAEAIKTASVGFKMPKEQWLKNIDAWVKKGSITGADKVTRRIMPDEFDDMRITQFIKNFPEPTMSKVDLINHINKMAKSQGIFHADPKHEEFGGANYDYYQGFTGTVSDYLGHIEGGRSHKFIKPEKTFILVDTKTPQWNAADNDPYHFASFYPNKIFKPTLEDFNKIRLEYESYIAHRVKNGDITQDDAILKINRVDPARVAQDNRGQATVNMLAEMYPDSDMGKLVKKTLGWAETGEAKMADGKRGLIAREIQSVIHQDARIREGDPEGTLPYTPESSIEATQKAKDIYKELQTLRDQVTTWSQTAAAKYGRRYWENPEAMRARTELGDKLSALVDSINKEYGNEANLHLLSTGRYTKPAETTQYKGTWQLRLLKSMLDYAAHKGYQKIGWITGRDLAMANSHLTEYADIKAAKYSRDSLPADITIAYASSDETSPYYLLRTDAHGDRLVAEDRLYDFFRRNYPAPRNPMDESNYAVAIKALKKLDEVPYGTTPKDITFYMGGVGEINANDRHMVNLLNKYAKAQGWDSEVKPDEIIGPSEAEYNAMEGYHTRSRIAPGMEPIYRTKYALINTKTGNVIGLSDYNGPDNIVYGYHALPEYIAKQYKVVKIPANKYARLITVGPDGNPIEEFRVHRLDTAADAIFAQHGRFETKTRYENDGTRTLYTTDPTTGEDTVLYSGLDKYDAISFLQDAHMLPPGYKIMYEVSDRPIQPLASTNAGPPTAATEKHDVWSFEITDKIRDKILREGQPRYQDAGDDVTLVGHEEPKRYSESDLTDFPDEPVPVDAGSPARLRPRSDIEQLYDSNTPAWPARKISSVFDRVRYVAKTPEARKVTNYAADVGDAAAELEKRFAGEYTEPVVDEILKAKLTPDEDRILGEYRYDMYNFGESPLEAEVMSNPRLARLSQIAQDNLRTWRDRQNAEGLRVEGRVGGKHPLYDPAILSQRTQRIVTSQRDTPEAKKLVSDLRDWWLAHGASASKVDSEINDYITAIGAQFKGQESYHFAALRKAAGYGLPKSWVEPSFVNRMLRYNYRAAKDLARFVHIENDPVARMIYNIPDQFGNKFTPEELSRGTLPDGTPIQANNPLIGTRELDNANSSMLRYINATDAGIMAANRLVASGWLGPYSGLRDLVSSYIFNLPYMRVRDMHVFVTGLKDFRKSWDASMKMGVNKSRINALEYYGTEGINPLADDLNRLADLTSKYQGRNLLEKTTRAVQMAYGRAMARAALASSPTDRTMNRFLSIFGKNSPTDLSQFRGKRASEIPEDVINDLAARWVEANQGSYDSRGLPMGAQQGMLSPFLALSRWNIEKFNRMYKDVWLPLKLEKDPMPLLKATLGAVIGGVALRALGEAITNRLQQSPTMEEAMDKKSKEGLMYATASAINTSGFFGFYGQLVGDAWNAAHGNLRQGTLVFPAYDFIYNNIATNLSDWWTAIQKGAKPEEATLGMINQIMYDTIQLYRIILNHTTRAEELGYKDKLRDLRVFRQLEGQNSEAQGRIHENRWENAAGKKFDRTRSLTEASNALPDAIDYVGRNSGGRLDKFTQGLSNIPEQRYNTIPSVSSPEGLQELMRYRDFITRTKGPEAWQRLANDYINNMNLSEAKKAMFLKYIAEHPDRLRKSFTQVPAQR